jgi:antitoxin VapB
MLRRLGGKRAGLMVEQETQFYREDVMGQLNIKDAALIADARHLAERKGTSVTAALRAAVTAALALDAAAREQRVQAILAIGQAAAQLVPPGVTSDHADLYDEIGLPR